jgi:Spy/CpxP family protein refolding chaperone
MVKGRLTRGIAAMVGGMCLFAIASQASAHDRMERLKNHLSLTDAQVTAIREVFADDNPTQGQVFQTLRQTQRELRQLALDGAEEAALQQKTAEITALMNQDLQLRVQRLQKIGTILTPEQRAKFAQLRDARWRMMKGGAPRHS